MSTPEKRLPFIQALIAKHNIPNNDERRRYQSVMTVLYADELAEANALNRDELKKLADDLLMKLNEKTKAENLTKWVCDACHVERVMPADMMPKAHEGSTPHVHMWRRLVEENPLLDAASRV